MLYINEKGTSCASICLNPQNYYQQTFHAIRDNPVHDTCRPNSIIKSL